MIDRIVKCILCIILVPILLSVLLVVAGVIVLLPVIALINPDSISTK